MNMTKSLYRLIAGLTIALTSLALLNAPSRAQSIGQLQGLQVAQASEIYEARNVQVSTQASVGLGNYSEAIRIEYVGSSTEATVTIVSSSMTFFAPNNVADTSIGFSGVIPFVATNTIGDVCDKINASVNYHCIMRDARRSDLQTTLLGQTAASGLQNLGAAGGFSVAFSSGSGTLNYAPSILSIGINPRKGKGVILKRCEWLVAADGLGLSTFTVSGVRMKLSNAGDGVVRDDSTLAWSINVATSPAQSQNFGDISSESGLAFAPAFASQATLKQAAYTGPNEALGRVVIRIANRATTIPILGNDYLRCYWVER